MFEINTCDISLELGKKFINLSSKCQRISVVCIVINPLRDHLTTPVRYQGRPSRLDPGRQRRSSPSRGHSRCYQPSEERAPTDASGQLRPAADTSDEVRALARSALWSGPPSRRHLRRGGRTASEAAVRSADAAVRSTSPGSAPWCGSGGAGCRPARGSRPDRSAAGT